MLRMPSEVNSIQANVLTASPAALLHYNGFLCESHENFFT